MLKVKPVYKIINGNLANYLQQVRALVVSLIPSSPVREFDPGPAP